MKISGPMESTHSTCNPASGWSCSAPRDEFKKRTPGGVWRAILGILSLGNPSSGEFCWNMNHHRHHHHHRHRHHHHHHEQYHNIIISISTSTSIVAHHSFGPFPGPSGPTTGPSDLSKAQARTLSGAHARKKPAPGPKNRCFSDGSC
jgi:hypothetical protein